MILEIYVVGTLIVFVCALFMYVFKTHYAVTTDLEEIIVYTKCCYSNCGMHPYHYTNLTFVCLFVM